MSHPTRPNLKRGRPDGMTALDSEATGSHFLEPVPLPESKDGFEPPCDIPKKVTSSAGTENCDNYIRDLTNATCKDKYEPCDYEHLTGEIEIGRGAFGKVYQMPGNEKVVYKISEILHNAIVSSDSTATCLKANDIVNNYRNIDFIFGKVNKLQNMMPKNVNKIISHKKCKTEKIKYLDLVSESGYVMPGYVLEYAMEKNTGTTMENVIDLLDNNDVLKTFLQLIYVVNVFNTNDFYHNDLKFNNVMISTNVVKNADGSHILTGSKEELKLSPLMLMYNGKSLQIIMEIKNTYIDQY